MSDKKIVEDILFELMILAAELPDSDKSVSIATIAALSKFKPEIAGHFIQSGLFTLEQEGHAAFTGLYADFLYLNDKEQLALDINNLSQNL